MDLGYCFSFESASRIETFIGFIRTGRAHNKWTSIWASQSSAYDYQLNLERLLNRDYFGCLEPWLRQVKTAIKYLKLIFRTII